MIEDVIRDFWGLILSAVVAIVWLVRLEASSKGNGSEIRRLWKQRAEDMDSTRESRDRMDRRLDEIASDIKMLLRGLDK